MLERATRREIEREAEDHITLGTLLRKQRGESRKLAVQKVLAGTLSVAQKITKIQAIDGEEDDQGLDRVLRAASEQATHQQVSRILHSVKLSQPGTSYLAFLFRERRRIREFGRRTHVMETRLLPPGVRTNPDLQGFFVKNLQSWAAELSLKLTLVTEVGWLHVSKSRYNLVVVLLKRLCERIVAFDFVHLDYRDRHLIDRMRRLESLFLALHYHSGYLDDLLAAARTVYRKQGKDEEVGGVLDLINRIMSPELTLPSLYNVVLGLNIVRYRRILTIPDLLRKGVGEVVSTEEFDAAPPVRRRIEEYIQATVDSVKRIHEQLFEVRRLNSYLDYDDRGMPDTRLLRGMYESAGPRGNHDFEADQGNVLLLATRFLKSFDRTFYPLLNGQLVVDEIGKVRIFSRGFFQVEFSRLRTLLERLEKGSFHFSNFPIKRYLQIKDGSLGAVGNEMEVVQLIDDEMATLVDLGKTLSRVLGMNGIGGAVAAAEPLEAIVLQGKPFAVPHAGRRIQLRSILNGRTVEEALADAVSICFSAGVYFHDRFIFLFLGRERKYAGEVQAKMRTLENVLDRDALARLKVSYAD